MRLEATAPEKKIVTLTRKECIKQAHYKNVDTGKRQVVEVIGLDGKTTKEERVIVEKVFIQAVFEDFERDVEVWVVKTQLPDGEWETHEFTTEEDANAYYRGL